MKFFSKVIEKIYGREGATLYLLRIKLISSTRWGGLYLHIFNRGDQDRDPHDHPWSFWTFPLITYNEEVYDPETGEIREQRVRRFQVHKRDATFSHRILDPVNKRRIVTLVWHGPKSQQWGFWVDGVWVHWKTYVALPGTVVEIDVE